MNNEKLKLSIEECLIFDYELDDGTKVKGLNESSLPAALREKGWQRIPSHSNFEHTVWTLGFVLVNAKGGRWTKGGYKFCSPCRAWIKPTPENTELLRKFRA